MEARNKVCGAASLRETNKNGKRVANAGLSLRKDRGVPIITGLMISRLVPGSHLRIGICLVLFHQILSLFSWYRLPRPGQY